MLTTCMYMENDRYFFLWKERGGDIMLHVAATLGTSKVII